MSWPPEISFQTVFSGVEVGARLVDVGELDRVADPQRRRRPAAPRRRSCGRASSCRRRSGRSRRRCRRAAARTSGPRRAAGRRSPSRRASASTTTSPSRGPGRDVDLDPVELHVLRPRRAASRRRRARAFDFACRARGLDAHPLELARERALARRLLLLLDARAAPASARARRVVALERDAPCRGRARGSSRRRCRGSSGRG